MKYANKRSRNVVQLNCKNKPKIYLPHLIASTIFLSIATLSLLDISPSHAEIIELIAESPSKIDGGKGGPNCQNVESTSTVRRSGQKAFKHWVNRCGERAELKMTRTRIGGTYWYGWSMLVPADWNDNDLGWDIVNQWAAWPSKKGRKFTCGGVGSKITRQGDTIGFDLQRHGTSNDVECTRYPLAKVSEVKGKWTDFVMQAKWTGNEDGFLKLWLKVSNGAYVQKIDYQGATFWNDEGTGPYFKMGLYKGDPNFKGSAPRVVYTDEYRMGDANSSFEQVAPGSAVPSNTNNLEETVPRATNDSEEPPPGDTNNSEEITLEETSPSDTNNLEDPPPGDTNNTGDTDNSGSSGDTNNLEETNTLEEPAPSSTSSEESAPSDTNNSEETTTKNTVNTALEDNPDVDSIAPILKD